VYAVLVVKAVCGVIDPSVIASDPVYNRSK
jgi:hypothetical protein